MTRYWLETVLFCVLPTGVAALLIGARLAGVPISWAVALAPIWIPIVAGVEIIAAGLMMTLSIKGIIWLCIIVWKIQDVGRLHKTGGEIERRNIEKKRVREHWNTPVESHPGYTAEETVSRPDD